MKITLLEKNDEEIKVLLEKTSYLFVNALRRAIINEVPTLAIEEVEFRKQTSALYDEILAHRLGLLPLKTDYSTYEYEEVENIEDRSGKSMVKLFASVKGPGTFYAEKIESNDPSILTQYKKMPLAKLEEGQEIEFEAIAVMGKGKEHSKWTPGIPSYIEDVKITVDEKKLEAEKEKYPSQIFEKGKVNVEKIKYNPELLDAVEGISDAIKVERKKDSFIFTAESFGMITPKEMIVQGIKELKNLTSQLKAAFE